jgi:hypothetical protein
MKHASLRSQIRQVCCLGLPAETLMPRLLPLLRQLVPAESAGFFWVDANGAMRNLFAERMLSREKMQLYFDQFYEGGAYDFQRGFQRRVQEGKSVARVEVDASLKSSAYYNEILRDLNAHHVLHGIVRDHGDALGQLSLYRAANGAAFDSGDETNLASVLHYVGHAIVVSGALVAGQAANGVTGTGGGAKVATAEAADGAEEPRAVQPDVKPTRDASDFFDTHDECMLLVSRSGDILNASEAARRVLLQAVDGSFAPGQLRPANDEAERLVKRLVDSLMNDPESVPALVCDGRWGRIVLRAYSLDEQGTDTAPVVVRLVRQEPLVLRFASALERIELPPQMREVAMHLAHGRTNADMAKQMGVAVNTVNYHLKQLYARLGTHGRTETVSHILQGRAKLV